MLRLKKLREALPEDERQKLLEKRQDPMRKAYNLMLDTKREQEERMGAVEVTPGKTSHKPR